MKKVISAVLTAAMVVGMGVSVLAATPSKTVADEVKASGSATVTGVLGIISDVEITAKDDTVEPAIALEGEHKVAEDGFTEFYPTETSIRKAIVELFWEPVEE